MNNNNINNDTYNFPWLGISWHLQNISTCALNASHMIWLQRNSFRQKKSILIHTYDKNLCKNKLIFKSHLLNPVFHWLRRPSKFWTGCIKSMPANITEISSPVHLPIKYHIKIWLKHLFQFMCKRTTELKIWNIPTNFSILVFIHQQLVQPILQSVHLSLFFL